MIFNQCWEWQNMTTALTTPICWDKTATQPWNSLAHAAPKKLCSVWGNSSSEVQDSVLSWWGQVMPKYEQNCRCVCILQKILAVKVMGSHTGDISLLPCWKSLLCLQPEGAQVPPQYSRLPHAPHWSLSVRHWSSWKCSYLKTFQSFFWDWLLPLVVS